MQALGEQCVIGGGIQMMQQWHASNWDIDQVCDQLVIPS